MYLGELGPPPTKTSLTRGTCPSPAFSLEDVKLSAIFSLRGKNLPFGRVILSFGKNLLLLRGTTLSSHPPLGNLTLALFLGKTGLFAFLLKTVTFPTTLSCGGVNLPYREKVLFLKEHSLNLSTSFSLEAVNLPHGGVGLSTAFSLGGMKSSSEEFILPFRESLISLENRLCCFVPYYIPFTEFLTDGGYVQTADHSFFNLSTHTRQYSGTHTFLKESFPTFLDFINALRLKLTVLIKAIGGKGSSSIVRLFCL